MASTTWMAEQAHEEIELSLRWRAAATAGADSLTKAVRLTGRALAEVLGRGDLLKRTPRFIVTIGPTSNVLLAVALYETWLAGGFVPRAYRIVATPYDDGLRKRWAALPEARRRELLRDDYSPDNCLTSRIGRI